MAGLFEWFPRYLTYPAPRHGVPSPAPPPFAELWLEYEPGKRAHAWWGDRGLLPDAPLAIHFHGNAETLGSSLESGIFDRYFDAGMALLAVEYPGYGRSDGVPSEQAFAAAADAAVRWARERQAGRPRFACGWSMGAAVAIAAAARQPEAFRGVIAFSPWTSLPDIARTRYPDWMVRLLLRERYDSLAAVRGLPIPILVTHGDSDGVIPCDHGRRVGREARHLWRLLELPGVLHDCISQPETWRAVREFLQATGAATAQPAIKE